MWTDTNRVHFKFREKDLAFEFQVTHGASRHTSRWICASSVMIGYVSLWKHRGNHLISQVIFLWENLRLEFFFRLIGHEWWVRQNFFWIYCFNQITSGGEKFFWEKMHIWKKNIFAALCDEESSFICSRRRRRRKIRFLKYLSKPKIFLPPHSFLDHEGGHKMSFTTWIFSPNIKDFPKTNQLPDEQRFEITKWAVVKKVNGTKMQARKSWSHP